MARSTAGRSASSFQRKLTCRLPSPAWPYARWRTPVASPIASVRARSVDDARPRHDDVLAQLVTRELARRLREHASRRPEAIALARVLRDDHVDAAGALARDLSEPLERRLGRLAVDLDEEHARRRAGRSRPPARAPRRASAASSSSRHRGTMPGSDDRAHGVGGGAHVGEERERRRDRGRPGHEAQRRLGEHAERALAARREARSRRSPVTPFDRALAGAHHAPAHQARLEPEHPVARDAVLERARAPRVLREVAADAAALERVGVGRVEEPLALDRVVKRAGDDARLDDGDQVRRGRCP